MRLVLIAAVVLALFHGMSVPCTAQTLSPKRVTGSQMRLSSAISKEIEKTSPNKPNIVISPASIAGVMALLDIGADTKMRGAIWDMLGFKPALGHDATSDLAALRSTITKAPANPKPDDAIFNIANVVMIDPAAKPYEKAIREIRATSADVSVAPLSDIANIKRINQWVAEKTKNLIPSILDEQPQPPGLIAVNALYFKGVWRRPFLKERTQPEAFHLVAGDMQVQMMHDFDSYRMKRDGDFAAIEMPYRGGRYSLVLVTNTAHSLSFEKLAARSDWLNAGDYQSKQVQLSLPRFKLEASEELLEPLKEIGLKNGMDSATAFEGLTAVPQQIARIVQKTFLNVDEEGTEAAAATAVMTVASARPREEPETLTIDRPFLFALRDRDTGLILMSGYVGKPVSGPAAEISSPNKFASDTKP